MNYFISLANRFRKRTAKTKSVDKILKEFLYNVYL